MARPDASAFAALAAQLQSELDEDVTARTIVHNALALLEDADEASLTVRAGGGRHLTLASTGATATRADALQYELGEGPCLEVAECANWFRTGDVASDPRWPRWGPRAGELGVGSVLAVRLAAQDGSAEGALNLYSTEVDAFADHEAVDLAQVYAVHAANALSSAHHVSGLQTALTSRHTIGLAQGILMERYRLDQQRSFELLRRTSSVHNMKLREVAAAVVETGLLPDSAAVPPTS
jgi:ANTAR domain/GAF domain